MISRRQLPITEPNHGPLRAIYDPNIAINPCKSATFNTLNKQKETLQQYEYSNHSQSRPPAYYWTDSEDGMSAPSSLSPVSCTDFPSYGINRSSTLRRSRILRSARGDIRNHFPIASRKTSTKEQETGNSTIRDDRKRASVTGDAVSGAEFATAAFDCACCTPRKRNCFPNDVAQLSSAQGIRANLSARRTSPRLLAMGAEVRAHVHRYAHRYPLNNDDEEAVSDAVSVASAPFGPVCPVPMPPAFNVPASPALQNSLLYKSVETQTSSKDASDSYYSERHRSRRSSGAKMISSIKKTIGHIRRAVSADRQERVSTPNYNRASCPSTPKQKCATLDGELSGKLSTQIKCTLLQRLPDKSIVVELQRTSTNIPFGFSIAIDDRGLYVSRLNPSMKSSRTHDLIHVADRVLEVQGVESRQLDPAVVSGLLRGCQVATFRLKRFQYSSRSRSRSSPFRLRE